MKHRNLSYVVLVANSDPHALQLLILKWTHNTIESVDSICRDSVDT